VAAKISLASAALRWAFRCDIPAVSRGGTFFDGSSLIRENPRPISKPLEIKRLSLPCAAAPGPVSPSTRTVHGSVGLGFGAGRGGVAVTGWRRCRSRGRGMELRFKSRSLNSCAGEFAAWLRCFWGLAEVATVRAGSGIALALDHQERSWL